MMEIGLESICFLVQPIHSAVCYGDKQVPFPILIHDVDTLSYLIKCHLILLQQCPVSIEPIQPACYTYPYRAIAGDIDGEYIFFRDIIHLHRSNPVCSLVQYVKSFHRSKPYFLFVIFYDVSDVVVSQKVGSEDIRPEDIAR